MTYDEDHAQVPEDRTAALLGELEAAMAAAPPRTSGWPDELEDLWDRTQDEPGLPLTDEQRQHFAARRERWEASFKVQRLLQSLREAVQRGGLLDASRAAALAEACVHARLGVYNDIWLLRDLGRPHGEQALARLVQDESVDEGDRREAREWLAKLRESEYKMRAAHPVNGEELLLPQVVRDLTTGRAGGWEIENEPAPERFAQARAVLEALLPDKRLASEEPPEWGGDWLEDADDRPAWLEVEMVLQPLVPDARSVTRERLIWGWHECKRLGIDLEDTDPEAFADRWATRIAAFLARGMLEWLWREDCFAPWALDLAMRYIDRNVAVAEATRLLTEAAEVGSQWGPTAGGRPGPP
ncbi:hypothetical protein STAFG_7764 [Streptomyces afghaniensis 772]|uniref:Uncharacterized protein n=1 Tax=Streptomyces afghaniensis 772 TaxID=1283301 RepID=S4MP29_9ACTN|nr:MULTISPECIES: hypothetical protein [Streptomyces]EPJ35202.1 hypothetical protein STAFG_7764 [Streptomyces afghaniensis 772]UOB10542.1 hypothetical protein MQE23_16335 [Streptomyces sp. HP-A2021]